MPAVSSRRWGPGELGLLAEARARAEPLAGILRAEPQSRPQKARRSDALAVKAVERRSGRLGRPVLDNLPQLENVPSQGRLEVGRQGGCMALSLIHI